MQKPGSDKRPPSAHTGWLSHHRRRFSAVQHGPVSMRRGTAFSKAGGTRQFHPVSSSSLLVMAYCTLENENASRPAFVPVLVGQPQPGRVRTPSYPSRLSIVHLRAPPIIIRVQAKTRHQRDGLLCLTRWRQMLRAVCPVCGRGDSLGKDF